MKLPSNINTFIKYFFVAVLGLSLDYICVLMALESGVPYQIALLLGIVLGGCVVFLLHTFWVFKTDRNPFSIGRILSSLSGPCLVYVVRFLIMSVWYSMNIYNELEYLVLFFSYGVSFISNFLFQKYFYSKY